MPRPSERTSASASACRRVCLRSRSIAGPYFATTVVSQLWLFCFDVAFKCFWADVAVRVEPSPDRRSRQVSHLLQRLDVMSKTVYREFDSLLFAALNSVFLARRPKCLSREKAVQHRRINQQLIWRDVWEQFPVAYGYWRHLEQVFNIAPVPGAALLPKLLARWATEEFVLAFGMFSD
jgi:hypothetical protein